MPYKKISINEIKILAINHTAFLGDVALTMPMVEIIKSIAPELHIIFVTTPQAAPIANCSGNIGEVIVYDKRYAHKGIKGIKLIALELKRRNVECIISPHRSVRSSLISYYSGAKIRVGFAQNAFSFFYKYRVKYLLAEHEVFRNFQLLKVFSEFNSHSLFISSQLDTNEKVNPGGFPIAFRENLGNLNLKFFDDEEIYLQNLLIENKIAVESALILIAPGSVWETKRWLSDYYIKLAELLNNSGFKCLIIGSTVDSVLCNKIANKSGSISLAGKLSIPQTLLLLQKSKLIITNDSAPTHFAGIVNCPVITIYGPTSPQFGFSPWSSTSKVIENTDLNCKPCAIHGSRKCPIGTHECMTSLKPEMVYLDAMKILG